MIFSLSKKEQEKVDQFKEKHYCTRPKYQGAIGGRYTYSFTPTSLGSIVSIKCVCSAEKDITDYDLF